MDRNEHGRAVGRLHRGWLVSGGLAALLALYQPVPLGAWGAQGHRLVGRLAESRLSPVARRHARWLLDGEPLERVAGWADAFVEGTYQTGRWHYVNIPEAEAGYSRLRDCPRQVGAPLAGRGSRWRDCIVDRIEYHAAQLEDRSLDRADRAVALKFLVHLVADVHQPFHALATGRGGNAIRVELFGSSDCPAEFGTSVPCNLHAVWDAGLMRHRGAADGPYATALEAEVGRRGWVARAGGEPADWAGESHALAKRYLVANGGRVDQEYYERAMPVVDERLALAAVRLSALVNRVLADEPPGR